MGTRNLVILVSLLAMTTLPAGAAWATRDGTLPPEQKAGSVAFLSGGSDPGQASAMQNAAARYPLEVEFLWGRGAKETDIAGVDWSIRDEDGHVLLDRRSGDPIVLASLPDGRYNVTATYDGTTLSRVVTVRKGLHDDLLLEWPQ